MTATPLTPTPPPTERQRVTAAVKRLAAARGLTISAVTTGDAFSGLADRLEAHVAAGRVAGMNWFTPERARFSADPRNLQPTARSILAVGLAYWSIDPGK